MSQPCIGCEEPTRLEERLVHDPCEPKAFRTVDSGFCLNCRRECKLCGDWIMGKDEIDLDGNVCHISCLADDMIPVATEYVYVMRAYNDVRGTNWKQH
jgi:hypothetical protein